MNNILSLLKENLAHLETRIEAACHRANRAREDVTLVAVTKTVPPEIARELLHLGVRHLGENRPQELWRKAATLPAEVHWHLIGHLQRNKIARTLPLVHCIHSVDSLRLLHALDQHSASCPPVLLEFNCSGEATKGGFAPDEVETLAEPLLRLQQVQLAGLMTMAPFEADPQNCRPCFVLLRQLRDKLRRLVGQKHPLHELSMGMSNDFEVAIEEGATMVRLGTVLFEGVPKVQGTT